MADVEGTTRKGAWGHIQDWDLERFGPELLDDAQVHRWSGALAIGGGLPYIWRELARPLCHVVYGLLELRPGDSVLIIGEGIEPAGWDREMRELIGPAGAVETVEIIREGRERTLSGQLGRNGVRGCWQWEYTKDAPDGTYDCVAVLQATQHCDDWRETGRELLRVMKPGRRIVSAEAVLAGKHFLERVNADVHIRQWHDKVRTYLPADVPYYSGDDLLQAFGGELDDPQTMEWRGIELFWGRRPAAA